MHVTASDGVVTRSVLVIGGSTRACAVTSHANRLYVSRHGIETVDIYDVTTLSPVGNISLPGVGPWPMGIAVDSTVDSLYISSYVNGFVMRVPVDSLSHRVRTFLPVIGRGPVGLSVSSRTRNVLVACVEDGVVEEYSSQWQLLRRVVLRPECSISGPLAASSCRRNLCCPWDVVWSPDDDNSFIVSDVGMNHHRIVAIRRSSGSCIRSYGRAARGWGYDQLQFPTGLAVGRVPQWRRERGTGAGTGTGTVVFVADRDNRRVVRLHSLKLSCEQIMNLDVDGVRQQPVGLHFDEKAGRLFVTTYTGEYVLVLDGVV